MRGIPENFSDPCDTVCFAKTRRPLRRIAEKLAVKRTTILEDNHSTLNRREVLQRAGGLMTATFATRVGMAEEPVSQTMTRLSTYMSEAGGRALPGEIIEKTKHHILDTFAAMISGSVLLPGQVAIRYARAHVGEKVATVAGSDAVCGAADAALANGMLAHSDETDDYAPLGTHPGAA